MDPTREPNTRDGERLARLTQREREVLILTARGLRVRQIAEVLRLSPKTVGTHRLRLGRKLDAGNAITLTLFAVRVGLVQP